MNYAINVPDHVEYADRYVAAAEARIKANAVKGRHKRFLENPANAALIDRMNAVLYVVRTCGEDGHYCHDYECPAAGYERDLRDDGNAPEGCGQQWQQQARNAPPFLWRMQEALSEWGNLTEGQVRALEQALDQRVERIAERAAEREAKAALSSHVGAVGQRSDFALKLVRKFSYDTAYGTTYGHVCDDADGNVVIYKGSTILGVEDADGGWRAFVPGDQFVIKATVKAHSEWEGIAQTLVARPKVQQ
jgi:hypothetical protein